MEARDEIDALTRSLRARAPGVICELWISLQIPVLVVYLSRFLSRGARRR